MDIDKRMQEQDWMFGYLQSDDCQKLVHKIRAAKDANKLKPEELYEDLANDECATGFEED